MAFRLGIIQGERCDKCKSAEGELLQFVTAGRSFYERNVIYLHERCLQKSIESAKKRTKPAA